MTPEERIQRGEHARILMQDPLLQEALDRIEKRAVEELLKVPTFARWGDRKRRALTDRVNAIRDLRSALETELALGRQAAEVKRFA